LAGYLVDNEDVRVEELLLAGHGHGHLLSSPLLADAKVQSHKSHTIPHAVYDNGLVFIEEEGWFEFFIEG
jgi:hypothetical protein